MNLLNLLRNMTIKKGPTQKEYKHKNKNIEYYTDEKGNIRRRRKR